MPGSTNGCSVRKIPAGFLSKYRKYLSISNFYFRKSSIEDELVLTETLNSDSQSPKPAEKVQQIVAPRIPPPPPNIVDNGGGGGTGPSGSTTTLMSR
jgi:hypothetical protein